MNEAEVIVFRGTNTTFSYADPNAEFCIGDIVEVPFGRSVTKGLIIKLTPIQQTKLKPIQARCSGYLPVLPCIVSLINWFYQYYQTTPYKAFQTICGLKKPRKTTQPPSVERTIPPQLTSSQQHIVDTITHQWSTEKKFYIHGITGAGKTELYLNLAQKLIENQQQVIFLLPEIALTPQFTALIQARFGEKTAVLHSGLTPKQKEMEWNRIQNEKAQIIIGPRSAIFAPTPKLGLIIIDEEHEPSYKQDNHPRYLTHTIAEERASIENAVLIYGSATPNVERYYAIQKKQSLFTLTERATGLPLPNVDVIDMKKETEFGLKDYLSPQLINAIEAQLKKKKKSLILLNRRGYASTVSCQKCGTSPRCPECNLGYTYHQDRTFRCHRCGIKKPATNYCDRCKKYSVAFSGLGIQKVQLELTRRFPQAHILRLDKDVAKNLSQVESILNDFKSSGDILIGTQMIAKGHDIKGVNLVGVLGIDATLSMPDFRSPERTFQLLTQVAGRAGRHHEKGQVIIQSYQADHYAIQAAKHHDFLAFYKEELDFREALNYPPFCSLINIIFSAQDPEATEHVATEFASRVSPFLKDLDIKMMGPKLAPIEKVRDHYRWNILFKSPESSVSTLKSLIKVHLPSPKSVRIIVDFDPYHIL